MKFGPSQALKELEMIKAQARRIAQIRQAMAQGDLEPFSQLELVQHQEEVINGLDFQAIKDPADPRKNHRSLSRKTNPLCRLKVKSLPRTDS